MTLTCEEFSPTHDFFDYTGVEMWETRSVFHISHSPFRSARWLALAPVVCSQRRMRPYRVVVHSPLFDHHLGLPQRIEDLALQAFILQLAVEALTVPALRWTAGLDFCRFRRVRVFQHPQAIDTQNPSGHQCIMRERPINAIGQHRTEGTGRQIR